MEKKRSLVTHFNEMKSQLAKMTEKVSDLRRSL
jgi:hypothetical protein